jgi:hypothetical protein
MTLEDALSQLLCNSALQYTTRKVQENCKELEMNGTYQLLVCTNDVKLLNEGTNIGRKNTDPLIRC